MNIALIFAGGTGLRMNSRTKPKQFLELYGKPIIIYTIESFVNHPQIDGIVVVCLEEWIERFKTMLQRYRIFKVKAIIPGGENGMLSIKNGVEKLHELYSDDTVILIHDGVRPLIDEATITNNIYSVEQHGSAITVSPAIETIALKSDTDQGVHIIDRSKCQLAKAPQSFYLRDIYAAHQKAEKEGKQDFIDSASLMNHYGYPLHTVLGSSENIKITTPGDFYVFQAIIDAQNNCEVFGF